MTVYRWFAVALCGVLAGVIVATAQPPKAVQGEILIRRISIALQQADTAEATELIAEYYALGVPVNPLIPFT